jgi:hypothetical protein
MKTQNLAIDQKIVDIINEQIQEWNEDWELDFKLLKNYSILESQSSKSKLATNFPNYPCQPATFNFEFEKKRTKMKDHPVAYESTDEGAQGRTTFHYHKDIIIEIYDAMDNYATITLYIL